MTNAETHILRTVFGWTDGAVSCKGHWLRLYKDQTRQINAANKLQRVGLVKITPDPEFPESIIRVTTAHE